MTFFTKFQKTCKKFEDKSSENFIVHQLVYLIDTGIVQTHESSC